MTFYANRHLANPLDSIFLSMFAIKNSCKDAKKNILYFGANYYGIDVFL
jgi:hypothetical protein